jgi:phospholipid/cholesterol/gamma-HCH transport system substrate-binding protein
VKRDHVNYVLVGTVVLAAFVVLLFALVMITGRSGSSTDYFVYYNNVTGLRYGAPVFYQGYRIGQVSAIDPERGEKGTRYKIDLSVRKDWPIPNDSVARLQSSGLLADVSIGIREGIGKQALASGAELKGEEGADIFGAMNELAGEVTTLTRTQISPLIRTLSERVDSITGEVNKNTPEIIDQTRQLLKRMNTASDSLNDLLKPENREAVAAILGEVKGLSKDLRSTKAALDGALNDLSAMTKESRPLVSASLTDLQSVMGTLSGRIDAIVHHLDSASRNVDEFSREIRKNPHRLLVAPKADKLEEGEE